MGVAISLYGVCICISRNRIAYIVREKDGGVLRVASTFCIAYIASNGARHGGYRKLEAGLGFASQ
jgi:hypothetical protein